MAHSSPNLFRKGKTFSLGPRAEEGGGAEVSDECWKLLRAAGEAVLPRLRQEISAPGSPWGEPWLWDGARSNSPFQGSARWRCLCWMFLGLWGAINRALTTQVTEISHKCDHLAAAAWRNELRV